MKPPVAVLPGGLIVAALAATAWTGGHLPTLASHGLGALSLAIALGALAGNIMPRLTTAGFQPGIRLFQHHALRAGVALYGFNLSWARVRELGLSGIEVDLLVVCSTLALGWFVGRKLLRMDRATTLLTTAGSAICGAAAIVATVPVLEAEDPESGNKAGAAVATVVLFGTLGLFVYPALAHALGMNSTHIGVYVGSTVHEVAQVIAIGSALGAEAAHAAIIAKMIRVMLLVPFLLAASWCLQPAGRRQLNQITIPWFALFFLAAACLHSTQLLSEQLVAQLCDGAQMLLTGAMVALGLNTTVARMRAAGLRPFLLGLILFCHLLGAGGLINYWMN